MSTSKAELPPLGIPFPPPPSKMDIAMAFHILCNRLLHLDVPLVLLAMFLLRRAAYKGYRLFIYPYFVSPLRHLPGPKVGYQTCGIKCSG